MREREEKSSFILEKMWISGSDREQRVNYFLTRIVRLIKFQNLFVGEN